MEATGRDPRGDAILDSVKAIFASKGFDGASMQDLAGAAGMSAGNFYRYFPSKLALVEALVAREIDCVRRRFGEVIAARDPLAALRDLVGHRLSGGPDDAHDRLWREIEAAAARQPRFEALLRRMEEEISRNLVAVFARIAALPEAEAQARFAPHARLLILLVQNVCVRCGAREADPRLAALVVRAIDHILSEIAVVRDPAPAPSLS